MLYRRSYTGSKTVILAPPLRLLVVCLMIPLLGCDSAPGPPEANCTPVASTSGPVGEWELLGLDDPDIDDITAIAVHPCDPRVIYAGSSFDFSAGIQGKLFKSEDRGVTWDTLFVGGSYRDIQFAPSNPDVIYALPGAIIKSTDGGRTWTNVSDGIELDPETSVGSITIHPERADVLYAGTGGSSGGGLFKSTNGGETWRKIGAETYLTDGVISLTIDTADPDVIYAGTAWSGVIMKSTDGGQSWTRTAATSHLVKDLRIDPQDHQILYAGLSDRGVLRSHDAGRTWEPFNKGLPDTTHVMKIAKRGADKLFLIASWNDSGGIYRYSIDDSTWVRIGLPTVEQSYYYSALELSAAGNSLYVGLDGVYRMNLQ